MRAEMAIVPGDCLATVSARTAGHGGMREDEWLETAIGSCMGLWTSGAGKREICCWRWRQCTRRRSKWYLLTLSRTSVPGRVQPGDVTREHFLVLVREAYAAVFPAPDVLHEGPTFAYVVRELHHNHPLLHLREPHLHLAGEWGRDHRWKRVAEYMRTRQNMGAAPQRNLPPTGGARLRQTC